MFGLEDLKIGEGKCSYCGMRMNLSQVRDHEKMCMKGHKKEISKESNMIFYRLKKDSYDAKAGTVFYKKDSAQVNYFELDNDELFIDYSIVENNFEWFEKVYKCEICGKFVNEDGSYKDSQYLKFYCHKCNEIYFENKEKERIDTSIKTILESYGVYSEDLEIELLRHFEKLRNCILKEKQMK